MTPHEFEDALDRWGPDLTKWPSEAALEARAHIAAQPAAQSALEAAAAVDAYLRDLRQDTAPAHLERQIVADVARHEARGPMIARHGSAHGASGTRLLDWLTTRLWRPALLALVPVAAGFLAGLGSGLGSGLDGFATTDADVAADMAMLAFSDLYAEVDDAQQ